MASIDGIGPLAHLIMHHVAVGDPPEIFPCLGSSRLEEPLTRYPVAAVFHGPCAQRDAWGRIRDTIPVYTSRLHCLAAAATQDCAR